MQLMTIDDICRRLRVSRTTLWRWRNQPCFPRSVTLPGGQVRFRQDQIDRWIEGKAEAQQ